MQEGSGTTRRRMEPLILGAAREEVGSQYVKSGEDVGKFEEWETQETGREKNKTPRHVPASKEYIPPLTSSV